MTSPKSHDLDILETTPESEQPSTTEEQQAAPTSESEKVNVPLSDTKDPEQHTEPTNPRLQALLANKSRAEETLAQLQAQRSTLVAEANLQGLDTRTEEERTQAALANANAVIKQRIGLLTKYNEIKDIAQGLIGLIAEQRGVRMGVVMEEFGMGEKD